MAVPERIGKYEISEQIGVGGFGAVYRGRDPFIKRAVAVKTCQLNDEEIKSRFFREAELAGNLHHRNITTIYDFGVENGTPYIVQEFLTGEDLNDAIKRKDPLPLSRRVEILIAISEGLHYAHENHIIHRDIKPANIRILHNGAVKIMDFGIAKSLQSESNLTQTGITLGTSAYLAPEQIRGETLDRRTDVFAVGVLAYELLTYQKPFRGEHLSTVLYRILNEDPEPIPSLNPEVPPALVSIVSRSLAKKIEDRYPSMEAMRQDLIISYRQLVGSSGRSSEKPAAQDPGGPAPASHFDPDETIKTPSKGMMTSMITPPSGAVAQVPAPETAVLTLASAARPAAGGGLELVNFRDSSEAVVVPSGPAGSAASPFRSKRTLAIGIAAAVVVLAATVLLVSRRRSAPASAESHAAIALPVASAPAAFPAPQAGVELPGAAQRPSPVALRQNVHEAIRKSEPAHPARLSNVQFSSIPVATLFVDGKAIGLSIPARTVELPEGKHKVRFEAPGLPTYEKEFVVGRDGAPPIAYRFPLGFLVINAPAWAGANVLIDSKFRGVLIGEKSFPLSSGKHRVTLSREGVAPYTGEVSVAEGEKKSWAPPDPTPAPEPSS